MSRVLLLFFIVLMNSVATLHAEASDVAAHLFGTIPPQTAESGKRWQLQLRLPSRDGVPGIVSASHLPSGADMHIIDKKWVMLDWRPAATQSGRYSLTLKARFDGEELVSFHQVVEIMVSGHEQPIRTLPARVKPRRKRDAVLVPDAASVQQAKAQVKIRPGSRSLQPGPAVEQAPDTSEQEALEDTVEQTVALIDLQAGNTPLPPKDVAAQSRDAVSVGAPPVAMAIRRPALARMATQIVSVGRTVSFNLRPMVAGGRVAAVHVDRLPRNASFERNVDGSRTFYWRTGHLDQGEHVFRFTANHPDDPSLLSYSDAVIIVGDPSKGGSAPRSPAPLIKAPEKAPEKAFGQSELQDQREVSVDARDVIAPVATADPFSDDFDPSLDRDLAPELDEPDLDGLEFDDEWDEPE